MTLAPAAPPRKRLGSPAFALGIFAALALAVFVDLRLSLALLPYTPIESSWPDQGWLEGFARWDSGWYFHIAENGYFYSGPNKQSAVAFFPAYPTAMRLVAVVVGDAIQAGIVVTLAAGAGAAVLFLRWCSAALGSRTGRLALLLLLLYPFSFYLFGAVYSDALFLLSALGAFSLLERDRPLLAGLVGMVATASRPVGVALVVGLVLRALEVRGVLGGSRRHLFLAADGTREADNGGPVPLFPRRISIRRLRPADAGVLLSGLGLALFCALLWWRFREPFAFAKVGGSAGWYRTIDLPTLAKVTFFQRWQGYGFNVINFWITVQGLFTLTALALVPSIVRRLGWGYGAYVLVAVGLAAASSKDFVGMGRYVLVAFPVFAVAADLLAGASHADAGAGRRWLAPATLSVSAGLLAWMVSLYARYYFLS
ncbi:MAG: hypothetical protein KY439_08970 [Actinobacteria bacterium]|nr:hypothetical protein [Actinomycetota bacterium]